MNLLQFGSSKFGQIHCKEIKKIKITNNIKLYQKRFFLIIAQNAGSILQVPSIFYPIFSFTFHRQLLGLQVVRAYSFSLQHRDPVSVLIRSTNYTNRKVTYILLVSFELLNSCFILLYVISHYTCQLQRHHFQFDHNFLSSISILGH